MENKSTGIVSLNCAKIFLRNPLESFLARPGIGLTVEYGSDHSACGGLIEPAHPLFHPEESLPLMSPDTVTEILEEVVPVSHRRRNVRCAPRSRTRGTSAENPNSVNEILVPGGSIAKSSYKSR